MIARGRLILLSQRGAAFAGMNQLRRLTFQKAEMVLTKSGDVASRIFRHVLRALRAGRARPLRDTGADDAKPDRGIRSHRTDWERRCVSALTFLGNRLASIKACWKSDYGGRKS